MLDPQTFVIPDNTRMEERTIVVSGGAIIGGQSSVEYGIIADNIMIGEHVKVCGEVCARSDVYIDRWSDIQGGVDADGDTHLGEFVKIHGKLTVGGDLDIGENVSINDGFEAKGWIMIKNPFPVIIFLYLYLSELLHHGTDEEVEKAIQEIFADDPEQGDSIQTMVIPGGAIISLSAIETDYPAHIGDGCRLQGNIRANSLSMGCSTTLFGSIRAKDVMIHENNIIHGNIDAKGDVCIEKGCHILGDVRARAIRIHRDATVDGVMDARGGITITETVEAEAETLSEGVETNELPELEEIPDEAEDISEERPADESDKGSDKGLSDESGEDELKGGPDNTEESDMEEESGEENGEPDKMDKIDEAVDADGGEKTDENMEK
ncbi:MAG: polymer-forming cytoskeletal protein [Euryarchaeota archaeon]|nr:polymer-forming cytoskeletal protein [Euryarchaeota archaeon]